MKHRIVALLLAAVILSSTVGCGESTEEAEVNAVTVDVQNPSTGNISVATEYVGSVAPEDEVAVFPLVSGTVTKTNYDVGDTVKAGAVLFTIDDTNAKLSVDAASASLNAAQASVEAGQANLAKAAAANELADIQQNEMADLSNASTLKTLNDQLRTAKDSVSSYDDQIDNLRKNGYSSSASSAAVAAAKAAYDKAKAEYDASVTAYKAAVADASSASEDVSTAKTSEDITIKTALAASKQAQADLAKSTMDTAKEAYDNATSAYSSAQASAASAATAAASVNNQIASLETAQDNMKTSVRSLEEQIRLQQATTALTKEQINTKNDEINADTYAAAEAGVAANEAQAQAAAVQVAQAQTALSYYTVTAPISGTIESISVKENQMAQTGVTAYTISNKDNMVVTFRVTETVAATLTIGDKITATRGSETYEGVITEIGGMADAQTKLFPIKASLGAVEGLASGISVKVSADTQKVTGAMTIPYDALYFQGGDAYVFVAEGDKAVRRTVTVGLMDESKAEIIDGLGMDDRVIVSWSSQLKDGTLIDIKSDSGADSKNADSSGDDSDANSQKADINSEDSDVKKADSTGESKEQSAESEAQ